MANTSPITNTLISNLRSVQSHCTHSTYAANPKPSELSCLRALIGAPASIFKLGSMNLIRPPEREAEPVLEIQLFCRRPVLTLRGGNYVDLQRVECSLLGAALCVQLSGDQHN